MQHVSLLIDWLTFTIKSVSIGCVLDYDFIVRFLGFDKTDFVDIGAVSHYEHCYANPNGIKICQAYKDRLADMGYCITFSGSGCRFFESHLKDGQFCSSDMVWFDFLRGLRGLNSKGYSVNVSRLDIAVDDKSCTDYHMLDLDLIEASANGREFVSQFRNLEDITSKKITTGRITGKCLYFGSIKSATSCKFYDKLAEQRGKCNGDKERLKEFEDIKHWVRMEFVFRRLQAVKMVNAICDSIHFSKFFAEVVNGYIRFVDPDDDNVSRCTVKPWWGKFIGTVDRTKLGTGIYKARSFSKLYDYYLKYLSTTVTVLMSRLSPSQFFSSTYSAGADRLKRKHLTILNGIDEKERIYTISEWWSLLNPIPLKERVVSLAV